MDESKDNLIPLNIPKDDFGHFLKTERNKRIFFSGKFGTGKTFFLQKFFEEHAGEYDTYHLFPIRYQISNNENIIELLKYDIFVELLKKYPSAFKGAGKRGVGDWFKLASLFIKKGNVSVNKSLLSVIEAGEAVSAFSPDPFCQALGKLGRPLKELLEIDKAFQEFKEEHTQNHKEAVEKFLTTVNENKDISATDYLSYLLCTKIAELKEKAGKNKSVLILDDFERIDPEHIFRILNIFSAHMEGDEDNKFGFDHLIVVGDIQNLKSIFHHKYGAETEFAGYFDKFFTIKPYEFDNEKAVAERIPYLLQRIKHNEPLLKNAISEEGIVKHFLEEVLTQALAIKALNLRQLYRPLKYLFPEVQKGVYPEDMRIDSCNKCINIGIRLLIATYNGKKEFLEVLRRIRDVSSKNDTRKSWLYSRYSSAMLRYMLSLKPGQTASWLKGDYMVVASQDEYNSSQINIHLDGKHEAHARFFYDTLIAYITKSKYGQQNKSQYER